MDPRETSAAVFLFVALGAIGVGAAVAWHMKAPVEAPPPAVRTVRHVTAAPAAPQIPPFRARDTRVWASAGPLDMRFADAVRPVGRVSRVTPDAGDSLIYFRLGVDARDGYVSAMVLQDDGAGGLVDRRRAWIAEISLERAREMPEEAAPRSRK